MTDLSSTLAAVLGTAYRLERELGGGGMSRVFLAEETALGRRVVIKVLPPDTAAGVNADRFRREILLAAQLQHPAIVPLLTAGASEGLLWYVMPFVEGASLRAKLARSPQLPLDEAVRAWRDLLEALEYAHEHNVVHRDIKPENIMLSGRRAVVLDFGVAKAVSASTGTVAAGMTGLGMAIGTPAYMAPEQIAGETNSDGRLDLYAAGLVMYEMLTGRGPFEATTASELMAAHIAKVPAPLGTLRAGLPSSLEQLVMQCLEKSPAARPRSVADVLQALDAMSAEISGARTPSAVPAPRAGTSPRRRLPRALLATVGIGLVATAAFAGNRYREQRADTLARRGENLADSARLAVLFLPAVSDPADSVLARGLSSAVLNAAQSDRRLLPLGDQRAISMALELGLEPGTVSRDTLFAMARDLGLHGTVSPAVARVGNGFLFSTEARVTANDSALFRLEASAADAAGVSAALTSLAEQTRAGLVRAFSRVPRPQATGKLIGTTPEAARLWTEAIELIDRQDYLRAADKARAAVALDSSFAGGWQLLSVSLSNAGVRPHERFVAMREAYRHRDGVRSRWVRSLATAPYLRVIGKPAEAVQVLTAGALRDPGQFRGQTENEMALAYSAMRRPDLAVRYYAIARDSTRRAPRVSDRNLLTALLTAGQVDEARREWGQYAAVAGDSNDVVRRMRHELAFALRDVDSARIIAARRVATAKSSSVQLTAGRALRNALVAGGQLDSAWRVERRRREILTSLRDTASLLAADITEALARAEFGEGAGAAPRLEPILRDGRLQALLPLDRPYGALVTALVATGRTADARRVLTEWTASVPPDLARVQGWSIATARGELFLAEKNGAAALAAFRAGDSSGCLACAWPNYARAYDLMGKRDSAIYWYEKYLASSSVALADSSHARLLARGYRRLAELHEDAGHTKEALQRYSDFVALWKNADASLQPAVKAAKERIARLQATRN
ncbi:MAG: protein kinase domain-containing protein [Gemmatimonas sp.]|uniref:serine/threonine-protein kinase n=1 Tax=Gemmatimonas sp. TaxID=1962908 RepID=UPI00391FA0C3